MFRTPNRPATLFAAMVLAAVVSLAPSSASACGGFFCNADTLSPIFQAGERVVFAPNDDGVTMHIEIVYEGEPTDFGWIMPIEAPLDSDGQIRSLEEILGVSSAVLFNQLTTATQPSFAISNEFENDGACAEEFSSPTSGVFDASSGADSSTGGEPPPVVILEEADIGPYGAQLIQATDADSLYAWLEESGYIQDPKALPLLEHYVSKQFVFLGLKLQTGKSAGDLQPVELTLGETYACVPLRLTAIAATPDMPMLVWVLGEHRAIPKNYIHAQINPQAIQWPGGGNYVATVTEAVNAVTGRAFVTEYASPDKIMNDAVYGPTIARAALDAEAATTAVELYDAVHFSTPLDPDVLQVLRNYIPMPDGLMGYPYGNCYYDPSGSEEDFFGGPCEENATHVTSEAEFYEFLDFWLPELQQRETPIEVDLDALKADLRALIFEPRERIQTMFDEADYITRFFTTVSPEEMLRDPIFSFNPDLPDVSKDHVLETVVRSVGDTCEFETEATFEDGSTVTFECSDYLCLDLGRTIGPVDGASALLFAEILPESGDPIPFAVMQAEEIDEVIDLTVPGMPSIPSGFEIVPPEGNPNPPKTVSADGETTTAAPGTGGGGGGGACGCRVSTTNGGGGAPLGLAFLALAMVGRTVVRRKTSH